MAADLEKIAIKRSNKEETKEEKADKIMNWLWGEEEKNKVLGLLKGKKKQLKDEKEVP